MDLLTEECKKGINIASVDVRPFLGKAGYKMRITALVVGLHILVTSVDNG